MFFGIRLTKEWKEMLSSAQQGLDGVRWTKQENLHLTLLFLGNIDQKISSELCQNATPMLLRSFFIDGHGVSAFPALENPRVLFASVKLNAELLALHQKLRDLCEALGIPLEARSYTPHITLGRVRRKKLQLQNWHDANESLVLPPFQVQTFELMEKEKHERSHRYATRQVLPLNKGKDSLPV
ncbi:MAG: RNA 2',3'-cyclic phosphodiesterase [Myxococcales bacterium]|nr:MAG: RNA 2',3'-cyclic phosphodiesterase [Myxococcales bacterium]